MVPLPKTQWLRLKLEIEAFDDAQFQPCLLRCQDAGFEFTNMADLRDGTEHLRALYELNKTCSADIPERGEFYTFEDYLAERIATPTYEPEGVVLAIEQSRWVGMAATSLHRSESYAFSEMTGVLPLYRRRGISLALKVLAIDFARQSGMRWMRTFHHPDNTSAIAMNRRLGFVDDSQT